MRYLLLLNTVDDKRYRGNAKDLYFILIKHLYNQKSNIAFFAIVKHGLDKFNFCVYEYFYLSKFVSNKVLTDLEISYIEKYLFHSINFYENSNKSYWLKTH